MTGKPNESYLFLLDVSPSMAEVRSPVKDEEDGNQDGSGVSKMERALSFIDLKLTHFIMRGLKTLEAGIVVFGSSKTNNPLTDQGKEGYDGIRQLVPLQTADNRISDRTRKISPAPRSSGSGGDLLSALICGNAILEDHVGTKKRTRHLVVVTDAEAPTQWSEEDLDASVRLMKQKGVVLSIVGIDFDDPQAGFKEENKSELKAENEIYLKTLAQGMQDEGGSCNSLDQAMKLATGPQMRIPESRPIALSLSLGNAKESPQNSLSLQVQYRKAIMRASAQPPSKLSMLDVKPDAMPDSFYDPHLRLSRLNLPKVELDKYALASEEVASGVEALERLFQQFNQTAPQRESELKEQYEKLLEREAEDKSMDADAAAEQQRQDQASTLSHEVVRGYARFIVPQPSSSSSGDAKGGDKAALKSNAEIDRTSTAACAVQGSSRDMDVDESAAAGEGAGGQGVQMLDMDKATTKAYQYGGTIVPVETMGEDELPMQLDLQPGIEIIGFTPKQALRREWILSEVGYINVAPNNATHEILFSALCSALEDKSRVALARYVGTAKLRPLKIGLLLPRSTPEAQWLVFVQMPFSEDLRRPIFPSLTRLSTTKGREVTKHPTLPTDPQNESMAAFIDAMDLDTAGRDESGESKPWFDQTDSYNPGIHNISAAIAYRHAHPLDTQLPPPHPELVKYMLPPERVVNASKEAFEYMKDTFEVKAAPIKLATGRGRKRDMRVDDKEGGEIDFDDFLADASPEPEAPPAPATSVGEPAAEKSADVNGDSSGTEESVKDEESASATEDEDNPPPPKKPKSESPEKKPKLESPSKKPKVESPAKSDAAPTETALVGTKAPLEDFEKLVAPGGNLVTEAVRDLLAVLPKLANEIGGRKWDLTVQCIERVRKVAAEEEEVPQFNDFLKGFKERCLESGGGRLTQFWKKKMADQPQRGLIHKEESEWSSLPKAEADEFIQKSVLADDD